MSDEQKIEGVPEGWRISEVVERRNTIAQLNYYEAILERIPKPKKRVMIAEFIVPEKACTGIYPVVTAEFHMQDDSRETIGDCTFRIEERDQPPKEEEEQRPKRQVLLAEAEVPPDFRIEDGGAIVAYRSGTGISLDIHRFNAEVFRIEERDA